MALHERIRKLTYDDYALIPEDGQRHEIIDGEHYVSPSPFIPHQDRRSGERLILAAELSAEAGDVLTTPLLPGFELPLSEIFSL